MPSKHLAATAAARPSVLTLPTHAAILIDDFSNTNVPWPSAYLSNSFATETNLAGTYNGRRQHLWSVPPNPGGGSANLVNTSPNSYLQYTGDANSPVFDLIYDGFYPRQRPQHPRHWPRLRQSQSPQRQHPRLRPTPHSAPSLRLRRLHLHRQKTSTTYHTPPAPGLPHLHLPHLHPIEIDEVHLTFQGTANASTQLDSITLAAPEPTTATLLALATLPLLTRRRK